MAMLSLLSIPFIGLCLAQPSHFLFEITQPSFLREQIPLGFPATSNIRESTYNEVTGYISTFNDDCELRIPAEIVLLNEGLCSIEDQLEAASSQSLSAVLLPDNLSLSQIEAHTIPLVEIPNEIALLLLETMSSERVRVAWKQERNLRGSTSSSGSSGSSGTRGSSGSSGSSGTRGSSGSSGTRGSSGSSGTRGSSGSSGTSGSSGSDGSDGSFESDISFDTGIDGDSNSTKSCDSDTCYIIVGAVLGGTAFALIVISLLAVCARYLYVRNTKSEDERNTKSENEPNTKSEYKQKKVRLLEATFAEMHREYGFPDCSICIIDFKIGDLVEITSCEHIFHGECLEDWLETCSENPKCPECGIGRCNQNPYNSQPIHKHVGGYSQVFLDSARSSTSYQPGV